MSSFQREIAVSTGEPPQRALFGTTIDGPIQDSSMAFTMVGVDVAEDSDPELNEINATNYNEVFECDQTVDDLNSSIAGEVEVFDPFMFDEEAFLGD